MNLSLFDTVRFNKATNVSLLSLCLFASSHTFANEVYVSADNKYVSEGRDNLGQGGALWVGATLWSGAMKPRLVDIDSGLNFSASVLYGTATDNEVEYDEFNLTFQVDWQVGGLDLYSYYNRIEYFELSDKDNEFAIGLNAELNYDISANTELIYNTATDGRFWVFNFNKVVIEKQGHTLSPHLQIGFDDGYASSDHKGYNHTAVGVTYAYQISSAWTLSLFTEYNFVGSQIEFEGGDDITWFNVTLSGQL